MAPEICVVIPTHNRRRTLALCLRALQEQGIEPHLFEVVVVDDGSTDGTADFLAEAARAQPGHLRFVRQTNQGPASARNAGVALALAPVVLLIDDDIVAGPGLLREHLTWHRKHADPMSALLGYVRWSDDVEVTSFMRFIDSNGMQFGYSRIEDGAQVDFRYFYACNLSLKRVVLLHHLFDTRFRGAAFEDIELGYRLVREGLALHFNRRAAAFHHRTVSFEQFLRRMDRAGASLRIVHQAHPELRTFLRAPARRRHKRILTWLTSRFAPFLPPPRAEAILHAYWTTALNDQKACGYRRRTYR